MEADELKSGHVIPTRQIKNKDIPMNVKFCFSDDLKSVMISYDGNVTMIMQQEDGSYKQ